MTVEDVLTEIQKKAKSIPAFGGKLKFDFGEGFIFIDGSGAENIVSNEDKEADCVITASVETFQKLSSGKLNPMMAMMTKKIKIKGDMGIAMKLQSLMKA